jgi:hypothetical protein
MRRTISGKPSGTTRLTLGDEVSKLLTLLTEETEPDTRFWLRPGGLLCPEVGGDVKIALAPSEASIGDVDLHCAIALRQDEINLACSPKQFASAALDESDKATTIVESDGCNAMVESDMH